MKVGHACAFLTTLALSLAAMIPAEAATLTFDWSATAASSAANGYFPFTGSGTLTVTTGASGDLVTNITGSFTSNGGTIVTDVVTGLDRSVPALPLPTIWSFQSARRLRVRAPPTSVWPTSTPTV